MIEFQCPKCGKKLRVKSEYAGRMGYCSGCQAKIPVPATDDVYAAEIVEEIELAALAIDDTDIELTPFVPHGNFGVYGPQEPDTVQYATEHPPMSDQQDLANRWKKWQEENPERPRWQIWLLYTVGVATILLSSTGLLLLFLGVSLSPSRNIQTTNIVLATYEEGSKGEGPAGVGMMAGQIAMLIVGILILLQALQWDGKLNVYERMKNTELNGKKLAIGVGIIWGLLVLYAILGFIFRW